jgi:ubiquinone/menaquinone biosynthesis C-methylase UbiE
MIHALSQSASVGAAFDNIANRYDDLFTHTVIGRAQRRAVWAGLAKAFLPSQRVLELNCGTGEDAFFLANRGVSVLACDASSAMIGIAERRKTAEDPQSRVNFCVLSNEAVHELASPALFDGAFSNFAGLNCTRNLGVFSAHLAQLLKPRARLLVCIFSRVCLWEILWFVFRGDLSKALRRLRRSIVADLQGIPIRVWYPSLREVAEAFAPNFRLRSAQAVGLSVPPSYLEPWARRHQHLMAALERLDARCAQLPILRACGDHILLDFEKQLSEHVATT